MINEVIEYCESPQYRGATEQLQEQTEQIKSLFLFLVIE